MKRQKQPEHSSQENAQKPAYYQRTVGGMKVSRKHVYQALNLLVTDLVNLSADGDHNTYYIIWDAVRFICQKQLNAGMKDPNLPEVLGDLARDPAARLKFYRMALRMARQQDKETCTILLELARLARGRHELEQASRYLNDALVDAKRRRNQICRDEALKALSEIERGREGTETG